MKFQLSLHPARGALTPSEPQKCFTPSKMNSREHAALRIVVNHETLDNIKQLQDELKREQAAHKRTLREYKGLKEKISDWFFY